MSFGRGFRHEGGKKGGAEAEEERWRERDCGATERRWRDAAIAIELCGLKASSRGFLLFNKIWGFAKVRLQLQPKQ